MIDLVGLVSTASLRFSVIFHRRERAALASISIGMDHAS